MKFTFSRPWESTIAILEDNIFSNPVSRWESAIGNLTEASSQKNAACTPSSPIINRRREPRFSLSLPVYHRLKGVFSKWKSAESIDVSQNGIRLAVDAAVPVGTRLELEVKLPDVSKRVRLEGVVVWAQPSFNRDSIIECGVAFQNFRKLSHKEKIIHFMADRLCGMSLREYQHLTCRPAQSKKDLLTAYHLAYKEYQARGYCNPNPAELHYSFYCMLPSTRTFLLEENSKALGTITLIVDSPCGLPMESLYGDKVERFRKEGKKLAEVSLLALDHDVFGRKSFSLTDFKKLAGTFRLFKILFDAARLSIGVSDLFIVMHPRHKDLYHYLTFETIGPIKSYQGAGGNLAVPMHIDIQRSIDETPEDTNIHRFFAGSETPLHTLTNAHIWNPQNAQEFLFKLRPVWHKLSADQQQYLKTCYPGLQPPETSEACESQ